MLVVWVLSEPARRRLHRPIVIYQRDHASRAARISIAQRRLVLDPRDIGYVTDRTHHKLAYFMKLAHALTAWYSISGLEMSYNLGGPADVSRLLVLDFTKMFVVEVVKKAEWRQIQCDKDYSVITYAERSG